VNNGLIVLLPKKPDAKEARDYRPIALIHSFAKLISKLLANRLAPKLAAMIGSNQSAFIKGAPYSTTISLYRVLLSYPRKRKSPRFC